MEANVSIIIITMKSRLETNQVLRIHEKSLFNPTSEVSPNWD